MSHEFLKSLFSDSYVTDLGTLFSERISGGLYGLDETKSRNFCAQFGAELSQERIKGVPPPNCLLQRPLFYPVESELSGKIQRNREDIAHRHTRQRDPGCWHRQVVCRLQIETIQWAAASDDQIVGRSRDTKCER